MTRYFMRDTPLQAMEQLMMSQPGQKPRGGGIYRSPFHYTPKDVACEYCQNYVRKHPCRLCECTCLEERIEAGVLELNEFVRDCFAPSNIMYTGVLRSGSTQSKAFPDLQIISPENFELAQKLMAERANECNVLRTMPRNTRGQSLLSGNVFCGHCGGRLTLTTNGTTRINAAGEKVGRKRIRYVCYNKTRKRSNCDGQTGYTMHILDKMVTDILHQVFDRMRSVEENEIISRTHRSAMVSLKKRLADAKAESAKATKEYESLKLEIIKAVQGESAFPMDILSELVNNARTRMLDANAQLTELNEEVEKSNQRIEAIKADYRRIMEWSEMFDGSDMDVKKMIAGYIIKRVDVYSDYRLHIEFNMSFAQFELGLETEVEYAAQDSVS